MNVLLDEGVPRVIKLRLTTDKNLSYQQNLMKRQLAAVVLPTNEIPIVIELLAEIRTTLETIAIGEFREISFPV